jgi:hypothetical protein
VGGIRGGRSFEEALDSPFDRVLRRPGVDRLPARDSGQRELRIELEVERRLAAEHVERVLAGQAVARPGDRRRADGAVREAQRDRGRVLDVAPLAGALSERDASRGRLHGHDLAAHRPLEVDAVTCALEHVPASLGAVEEPRPALRRPGADPDQEAELLALERAAQVVEHLDCTPLVADGADGLRALGRVDD